QDVPALVSRDLFTEELRETLGQFEQAKNFGSLIVPKLCDPAEALRVVEARDFAGDLLLKDVQERVVAVLRMAEALSPKYHVVVANPPYMGGGGMNEKLADFAKSNFPNSKYDLFAMFIERALGMSLPLGSTAMITIQNWMFLSSFEELRKSIVDDHRIFNLLQIGYNSFPELNSKVVQAAAFVIARDATDDLGVYINLNDAPQSANKENVLKKKLEHSEHYVVSSRNFQSIPGAPIAYWVNDKLLSAFTKNPVLTDNAQTAQGMATSDNGRFLRCWSEVSIKNLTLNATDRASAKASNGKWFPYNKGGEYRTWYGNQEFVVNWLNDGHQIRNAYDDKGKLRSRPQNLDLFFLESASWSKVSSGAPAFRYFQNGFAFDVAGTSAFFISHIETLNGLGFLNSTVARYMLSVISPTLNYEVGHISSLPYAPIEVSYQVVGIVGLSKSDWDAYETSWDFTTLPLLQPDHRAETLEATYTALRAHWQGMTEEMQQLEEENNRIFIDAYGLQDELTPEVPLKEITLTCNPAYRYGIKNDAEANETRLRADTMAEFLSYAVGCMFGRYSLDAEGLILANQGETLGDYLARIHEPSFMPDKDNVIPVLDANWFPDDITERFRLFLRTTFGETHFRENLRYIEDALGKDIRKYFTKDFYADHVKRYKKRPIYWMFSSPKGTFNALIYMHRYQSDTVSVLLNEYLREFITKLEGERARLDKLADDPSATQGQKAKAIKDTGLVAKQIDELNEWEREVIFPMAQQKIEIDLDDGVKKNYPIFGTALKKVTGLS
ncbi:BREX-1 system adenine-specific DNA-methyltransferase PglX, partial [Amylibacter sp.]|nr:BREX-1 system adenine-specific DNA-methyltransferase PglX [Amylibacter sp.]